MSSNRESMNNHPNSEIRDIVQSLQDGARGLLLLNNMKVNSINSRDSNSVLARLVETEKSLENVEKHFKRIQAFIEFENKAIDRSKMFCELLEKQREELEILQKLVDDGQEIQSKSKSTPISGKSSSKFASYRTDSPKSVVSSHTKPKKLTARKSTGSASVVSESLANVPTLSLLTKEELSSLPSHVRGHLSLSKINTGIEDIQQLLERKYTILASAKLTAAQQNKAKRYKSQESKETKGEYFFSSDDLKECEHLHFDASGKSILSLLRHTRRIKQVPGAKWFRYIILDQ